MKFYSIALVMLLLSINLLSQTEVNTEGNSLLLKIDNNLMPESTVFFRKIINIEPNGRKKEFVMFSAKKGKDKLLSTFLAPKTEVGRHTLRLGDNMWLYIPNVGKPIRITSLQSVTGGLFNNSDIMRLDFSEEYECIEYSKEEGVLVLKAKNKSVAYDKLIMVIDKTHEVPIKIECYTSSEMLVKTLEFKNIKEFDNNIIRPEIIETYSPLYKNYKSVMIYAKIEKKEIKDEIFTVNSMNEILKLR